MTVSAYFLDGFTVLAIFFDGIAVFGIPAVTVLWISTGGMAVSDVLLDGMTVFQK